MRSKYDSMLPSGDSQMQGGNSETGGRHDSPRKQEKPHTILQVVNKVKALFHGGQKRAKLYDQKEYERGVKAVLKGKSIVKSTHEAIEMLIDQQTLLGSIPLDAMRNNSNKLVNQDMDVVPLEEMNLYAECILRQVAENMHNSKLMSRYVEELTKKDREKWQQVSPERHHDVNFVDFLHARQSSSELDSALAYSESSCGRWPLCQSLSCRPSGASMSWRRTWSEERRSRSHADRPA
jgi:hypothetical protein